MRHKCSLIFRIISAIAPAFKSRKIFKKRLIEKYNAKFSGSNAICSVTLWLTSNKRLKALKKASEGEAEQRKIKKQIPIF